jgi:ParB/RepB/Spo0J family partition protein
VLNLGRLEVLPLSSIVVGERARKVYGDIDKLADSIKKHGLMQPIVVHWTGQEYQLVAGGRRLEACKKLSISEDDLVSCRVYEEELSEKELRALELFENIHRKNLLYSEECALIAQLDETLKDLYGTKVTRSPDAPGHSSRDTAKLIGKSPASVTMDKQLADAMKKFPELGLDKMKNKSHAMKTMRRLSHMLEVSDPGTDEKEENSIKDWYGVGDVFEELEKLLSSDTRFDLIELDPPYGIDLVNIRQARKTGMSSYTEVERGSYSEFCGRLSSLCWNLAEDNSWLLWWFGHEHYGTVLNAITAQGFVCSPIPLIWKKGGSPGQTNQPDTYLAHAYETCLYARKGSPKLRKLGRSNIFDFPPVFPSKKVHPTERPLSLMSELLETFTWKGADILVPLAGSGVTLWAAYLMGATAIGFDNSEEYRRNFIRKIGQGWEYT